MGLKRCLQSGQLVAIMGRRPDSQKPKDSEHGAHGRFLPSCAGKLRDQPLEWIQAESGRVEHPMVIEVDNEAWGGKYVRGIGNMNGGSVTLSIPVPTAGDYYLECRIKGPDWNQDSM